jgi:hypothetical protein
MSIINDYSFFMDNFCVEKIFPYEQKTAKDLDLFLFLCYNIKERTLL